MRWIYMIAADVLRALGWEVEINEKENYWNLVLTNTTSSEDMPESHKSCLRGLLRGWLMEFNYEGGRQQVNIYKELHGLNPENDRYSCLDTCVNRTDSNTPEHDLDDKEIFVRRKDRFDRYVLAEPATEEVRQTIFEREDEANQPLTDQKAYDDMLKKPRLMLQWSRNTFGYHHMSAWALNDKGEGCYEYAVAVGINKLSALLRLVRQMKRMGYLHLLRYVVKQETVSDIPGRVKHFRIEQVTDTYFLIRQRHTLLFFIHFYDSGAELLCPDYRKTSRLEAMDFISKTAREKGFDYRIHEK